MSTETFRCLKHRAQYGLEIYQFCILQLITLWTQNVNWANTRRSEDVSDAFWTFHACSIYVLLPRALNLRFWIRWLMRLSALMVSLISLTKPLTLLFNILCSFRATTSDSTNRTTTSTQQYFDQINEFMLVVTWWADEQLY